MVKNILQRASLGFPLGVFIGYTITIVISFYVGHGSYSPVVPSLAQAMGSELNAVVLQYVLSGILGAGFSASSLAWEIEEWSIARRTIVHFVVSSVFMFPVAYFNRWMEPTLGGVLGYVLVFVGIYAIIWLVQYIFWMRKVREINQRLKNK